MQWRGPKGYPCSCRCPIPGMPYPGWWSYLQWPAAERLLSCVQPRICSTIVSQQAPLISTSLSHTLWLSERYSLLPLSASHLLPLPFLCPTLSLSSSSFSPTGKSPERGSSLDALPSHWIMTQQSYFIRPFLFLPCFPHRHSSRHTDTLHSSKWGLQAWMALLAPIHGGGGGDQK